MAAGGDIGTAGDDVAPTVTRKGLRERALAGLPWTTLSRLAAEVVRFGGALALARLVSPREFGFAAMAFVVTGVAAHLVHETLAPALVQRERVDATIAGTATTLSLLLGGVLAAATVVLALTVVSGVFGDPVVAVLLLAAPVFLLRGLTVVPVAELQRRLDFRRLGIVEVCGVVGGTAIAVVLALQDLGARALALGLVGEALIVAAGVLVAVRPRRPRWERGAVRELLAFGVPTSAGSLVWSTNRQVDYAILGATLSAAQVGFYYRAFQLGVEYPSRIFAPLQHWGFSIFARARDAEDRRRMRRRVVRVTAAGLLPVLGLFVVVAPELVPWLLGERWEPAVVPAQLLAVAGGALVLNDATGSYVLACGRPRPLLWFQLAFLAVYAVTVALVAPAGITAVCAASAGLFALQLAVAQVVLVGRVVGTPAGDLFADLVPGLAATAGVVLGVAAAMEALALRELPVPVLLAVAGAIAAPLGLAALRVVSPAAWGDLVTAGARFVPRAAVLRQRGAS